MYKYHVISWIIYLFTLIMKQTIAVLGTIGLTAFGVIPPWSDGGIYCDDPSINFKFQGDSVPTLWLFIGLLIPPLLVVSMSIFYISVYEYWILNTLLYIILYTYIYLFINNHKVTDYSLGLIKFIALKWLNYFNKFRLEIKTCSHFQGKLSSLLCVFLENNSTLLVHSFWKEEFLCTVW